MPRTLPDIHEELSRLVDRRKQAWAESDIETEAALSEDIERCLDEILARQKPGGPV